MEFLLNLNEQITKYQRRPYEYLAIFLLFLGGRQFPFAYKSINVIYTKII